MDLFEKLAEKCEKLAVVGLGYVGMPLAVAFSEKVDTIGFDVNKAKIDLYKEGKDPTNEVGDGQVKKCAVRFTADENELSDAKFFIVAVPTPVKVDNTPDLSPVAGASEIVGRHLTKGAVVVFESTVYPGVTEEICVPIMEKASGLKCGEDFKVGYSPERINPGDKVHTLRTIVKIVSGMDAETLDTVAKVYEMVVSAGVYRAESIKVAEAAKVIENSQRDINIAFMNELAMIFGKMNIDTRSVIEAASTKWNFLKFYPGLVGGHCIGVDPYYLTFKADQMGYHSQIILAGRRVNNEMGGFVAENVVKLLIRHDISAKTARVGILGVTFKENCPDTRNTKVIDIINELKEYSVEPMVCDPHADALAVEREYGVKLCSLEDMKDLDAIIIAVAHNEFKLIPLDTLAKMCKSNPPIIADVKGILNREDCLAKGYEYWRL